MKANSGFTLIELILVTVIIGILAGTVTVTYVGRTEQARINRAMADIVAYSDALELYAIDNNDRYPGTLRDVSQYVRKYELDPWGNEYIYTFPGQRNPGRFDLYSAGPDGIPGTEDDIVNWTTN
jgi:general secretion pathway protein G